MAVNAQLSQCCIVVTYHSQSTAHGLSDNIGLVAKSYKAQLQKYPDLKLVMVGDGPLKAELEEQLPEALFLGVKRGDELAADF